MIIYSYTHRHRAGNKPREDLAKDYKHKALNKRREWKFFTNYVQTCMRKNPTIKENTMLKKKFE